MTGDRTPSSRADLCIIGAGVAGGLVGHQLATEGFDVVFLEAGRRFDFDNRLQQMEKAIRPEHDAPEVWEMGGPRDRYSTSGDINYNLNRTRVKGVGGTTLHWLGNTHRLHEKDFEMESRYNVATDWPISYHDLRPYYAAAERELGVSGADSPVAPPREESYPLKPFPKPYSDTLFEEACEELGISTRHCPQARNSEPYDGRSQCLGYNTCIPVCPSGAKYSGDIHIGKAEEAGARVIDRAPVERLEHGDAGTITAAQYVTPDGTRHRQEARHFILACGAVENPRLLLMSKSTAFPDGLANGSGAVGRYFMEHPIVRTSAEFDRTVNPEPIGFITSTSEQFYDPEEAPPGGVLLEFTSVGPASPAAATISGGFSSSPAELSDDVLGAEWGDELLETTTLSKNGLAVGAVVEMLPRETNRVTLDTEKTDDNGNPVPDLSFGLGQYETDTFAHAFEIHERILDEMGATILGRTDLNNLEWASHHMGTTRMGDDPTESVVDQRLRSHEVDNLWIVGSSVFPTGGAVAPTLTIAALSLRAADHIEAVL